MTVLVQRTAAVDEGEIAEDSKGGRAKQAFGPGIHDGLDPFVGGSLRAQIRLCAIGPQAGSGSALDYQPQAQPVLLTPRCQQHRRTTLAARAAWDAFRGTTACTIAHPNSRKSDRA